MKKIAVLLLVLGMVFFGCVQQPEETGKGTLVLQLTDNPSELNIESAMVTISNIEVHLSASGEEQQMTQKFLARSLDLTRNQGEEQGNENEQGQGEGNEGSGDGEANQGEEQGEWVTVVEESQTFDLIALKDVKELLGTAELEAGHYTQIRLNVESALVTIDGVEYDLEVPSDSIKLVNAFTIKEGNTTTLTLDFDIQESVHATGSGKYILQPTIKVIEEEQGNQEEAGNGGSEGNGQD